ncbi:MAG TPA: DUF1015 domain-containing protein [Clostridiales bacterium]|jgi:hypothetical protein|nr:DUF1015 domain-containing protein [Clostridiales bacterium]HCG35151.1 DUF1015 domain-containing protein [Clostridiales bacterium]
MKQYPLMPADLYMPKRGYETWAVIACDQFTSEPAYWEEVEKTVGDKPSALHITLPELYLSGNVEGRIAAVNATMEQYLQDGVFEVKENAMVYVERVGSNGHIRHGIVGAIDLEWYDYHIGSKLPIRATEQTVLERIPPRLQIRKNAPLEAPHVLLLVDDPGQTVVEPLKNKQDKFEKAYDFDLMMGGGHITGYYIDLQTQTHIGEALEALKNKQNGMVFAVGDGNHSLATAKESYLANKNPAARYALVEVVNIHDEAITFEPIYRVLFNVRAKQLLDALKQACNGGYQGADAHRYLCVTPQGTEEISLQPTSKLPVGTLQTFLDAYLQEHREVVIDYIHGEEAVYALCQKENTLGFLFAGMKKDELFDAVEQDGSLPRKTFSMGQARDKRYYIECKKII